MKVFAWTITARKVMQKCGTKKNGRPAYKPAYVIHQQFPKLIHGAEIRKIFKDEENKKGFIRHEVHCENTDAERDENTAWTTAELELDRLLRAGKNLMGVVIAADDDMKEYGIALCSASERKFRLGQGVNMATGRLKKKLEC